jgi:hypothetical protein
MCVCVWFYVSNPQASHDPATIAGLLQQHPYHVDALLAMHDLYRHMGPAR